MALTVNSSFGIGGGGCFAGCESGVPIMLFIEGGFSSNSDVKVICIRGIGGSDDYCLTAVAAVILATMVIV